MTSYESDKSNLSFSEKKIIAFSPNWTILSIFSYTYFFGENDKLVGYKLENDEF